MHTITDCPRCGKDFMYHQSDVHLKRTVAWDADTKEPCSFETICRECHEREKFLSSNNCGDSKFLLLKEEDIMLPGDEYYNPISDEWLPLEDNDDDIVFGVGFNHEEVKPVRRKNPNYIGDQPL